MNGFRAHPGARVLTLFIMLMLVVSACAGTSATSAPSGAPSAAPSAAPTSAPSAAASAAPTAAPTTAASAAPSAAPTAAPSAAASAAPSPSAAGAGGPVLPGDPRFEQGTPGGTLTGAWVGPCCVGIDSMNAFENSDGSHNFTHLIYEHLLTFAVLPTTVSTNPFSGQYSDLVPALAKSWEVSSDQLTWTFKLQEGVKWHDGGDFTSEDVKFTFETCLNPQAGVCAGGANLATIVGAQAVQDGTTTELEGVQAPDPLTVTITTTAPNALLPQFVMNLFIMSKAALGQVPVDQIAKSDYWYTPGKAVGTGPFKLTGYTAGQSMTLSRHDDYWRSRPFLDEIIRRNFQDTATALLAFEAGEIDYTYLTADEVARASQIPNATVLPGPSGVDLNIVMNPLINQDWADKRVRQAILHAIDREEILRAVYGIADPKTLSCLYVDPNLIPDDVKTYPYDPERAKALLAEAGVDPTSWGEIVFDTYYGDPGSLAAMTAIQANLADIGVTVSIQQLDSATWVKRYYEDGKSEFSMIGGDGGLPNAGYGRASLHSDSAWPKGGNGFKGWNYSNPEIDRLFDQLSSQFDVADQQQTLRDICRIHAEEQPYVQLWATTRYWFINNRIGNFVSTPGPAGGNYYAAPEMWYVRG
jgi:peptide/nickel transport system substrate-binding protein